jgi:hypothetical protein
LREKFDSYVCVTEDVIVRLPYVLRERFEDFLRQGQQTPIQRMKRAILSPLRDLIRRPA